MRSTSVSDVRYWHGATSSSNSRSVSIQDGNTLDLGAGTERQSIEEPNISSEALMFSSVSAGIRRYFMSIFPRRIGSKTIMGRCLLLSYNQGSWDN